MTAPAGSESRIDGFLARLRAALRGMPEREIDDILEELRSHITDLAEYQNTGMEQAIRSLGDPVDLAKSYRAQNLLARAECSGAPLVILQGLRQASGSFLGRFTVSVLYIVCYVKVVTLWAAAILKFIWPARIGLWHTPGDLWSLSLVTTGEPPPGSREILGWWLVPTVIAAGWFIKYVADHVALWWIRRYRLSKEVEAS